MCGGGGEGGRSPIFNNCGAMFLAEKYQKLKLKQRIQMSCYFKIKIKCMRASAMADVNRICFVK